MPKSRSVDYQAVLDDLRARRDRIDAAIRAVQAVMRTSEPASESQAHDHGPMQCLSLIDAARLPPGGKATAMRAHPGPRKPGNGAAAAPDSRAADRGDAGPAATASNPRP